MGLVFGLYILNAFGDMIGEESLEILSPFKHFAPAISSITLPGISIDDDQCGHHSDRFCGSYVLYHAQEHSSAVIKEQKREHFYA
jgi:hypothetical protein